MNKWIDENMIAFFGLWIYDLCSFNDNVYHGSIPTLMIAGFSSSKITVSTKIKSHFNHLCINFLKDWRLGLKIKYTQNWLLL